uniref:Tail assembly chaperone n=1 Tax=Mycobacterium phage BabyBack TaxID=3158877 RepID=A0AAU8GRG6_9CAUD
MSAFAEHREVRVTARKSVTPGFIAPDLSPTRLVDRELEKGLKGWTDFDVKLDDIRGDHLPKGFAERQLEAMSAGMPVRKARPARQGRAVLSNGPTSHYKAMQARAAALSAR